MNTLEQKLTEEIEHHREQLLCNLGAIADMADKPLSEGHLNVESAVMERMREIVKVTGEQHSRCHQIRALKSAARWLRESANQNGEPKA